MNTERICPSCGKPVVPDAPQGLCPECLMKGGMASTGAGAGISRDFVPPSVHDIAQLFPQLEIIDLIGHGGMGAVYKARQPGLDRLVALKILPPRPSSDPGFTDRFTREARALAKLNHPNIVAVYDFGQVGDLNYFLMEYVDGPNLRQLEGAAKLTPAEALKLIPQICEALQFAHDAGIVHRDIKPENVLLDKKGRVKIADFGLAKILGQPPQEFRLTGTRDVMGTPHYMAPEQVEHPQSVDHRADIYSLGVVFYEMLTGELPLGRFGPPSSRAHDVKIDVRLDEVVLRTLEREPERRYQQASQVKTDVECIAHRPEGASTSSPRTASDPATQDRLRKEIRGPAIGLIASAIVNWLVLPLLLALITPALSRAYGVASAPTSFMPHLALWLIIASPFVVCSFVLFAALKMQRLEAYSAAVAGSILAMLVTPGNLIGLPVGIWALVILARQDVREAFRQVRLGKDAGLEQSKARPLRRLLAWGGAAVLLVATLLTAFSWSRRNSMEQPAVVPKLLFASSSATKPLSEEIEPLADGSFRVNGSGSKQVFRLFEVGDPEVENCVVFYQAKIKSQGLTGRAYLEMWCHLPGLGESFSRGFDSTVSGTTDWVTTQTPFVLKRAEKPDLFRLNLVVEGSGAVLIKDLRLESSANR